MAAIKRLHVGPRLSEIVIHGDAVYLAGEIAENTNVDAEAQTREILASIDRLLAEAGTDKTKILSALIFLSDMRLFAAMNKAWDAWVPAGNSPARATVEAKLATPQHLVEIKVVAAL
jgi:enamine deaminase RidA (YjgF/YER057c/UK114 family)